MNNISFQGKTNLRLDTKRYMDEIEKIKRLHRHLKPDNNYTLQKNQLYAINPDIENMLVLVKGEKHGFAKYLPLKGDFSKFINDITIKTEKLLSESNKKLTAWIIGGDNICSKNGDNTIRALNEIAEVLCDRPDIDTSILVGTKNLQENILIHTPKEFLGLTLEKSSKNNIEDLFDIVELNNTEII